MEKIYVDIVDHRDVVIGHAETITAWSQTSYYDPLWDQIDAKLEDVKIDLSLVDEDCEMVLLEEGGTDLKCHLKVYYVYPPQDGIGPPERVSAFAYKFLDGMIVTRIEEYVLRGGFLCIDDLLIQFLEKVREEEVAFTINPNAVYYDTTASNSFTITSTGSATTGNYIYYDTNSDW